MDWIQKARRLFKEQKPEYFTNYTHCEECFEHNQTLASFDCETIGLNELGNPAWDPMCFCSAEGKKYYTPAFVRLTLESIYDAFYLDQFLFHLEVEGQNNVYYQACSIEQRAFISDFLSYLAWHFPGEIEQNLCAEDLFRVIALWSE